MILILKKNTIKMPIETIKLEKSKINKKRQIGLSENNTKNNLKDSVVILKQQLKNLESSLNL